MNKLKISLIAALDLIILVLVSSMVKNGFDIHLALVSLVAFMFGLFLVFDIVAGVANKAKLQPFSYNSEDYNGEYYDEDDYNDCEDFNYDIDEDGEDE